MNHKKTNEARRESVRIKEIILDQHGVVVGSKKVVPSEYE